MKRQTGFTLVELVIVIAVLGILAGLAIPYFMEAREEAAKKECLANRTQIMRMFHAQQAVGYSGDLDGFLKEVTKEKDNENKYFTFVPKCADGGKYEVKVDFVTCDFPGHDEDLLAASSIPEDILKKFNDMIDSFYKDGVLDKDALNKLLGITNADDKTLTSNDLMRKAFFEKYGGWIEGIGDQRLVRVLKRLSISEKELLTKYCIEDKTQQEIAAEMGLSQRAVGKQLQQLKKFFKKF